jgi:hypothetical protein
MTYLILCLVQTVLGMFIVGGSFAVLSACQDKRTPKSQRGLYVALLVGGTWFMLKPAMTHHHSCLDALVFGAVVVHELFRKGGHLHACARKRRQARGESDSSFGGRAA